MTKEFFEKLLEGTIFIFLSGIILLLLGATGGVTVGTFQLSITDVVGRIGISLVGIILIGIGIFFQVKEYSKAVKTAKSSLSVPNVLTTWDTQDFKKRLKTAVDVRMSGVSNYGLLSRSTKELQDFLGRGGQLRCIYVSPEGNSLKMVAMRSVGIESEIEHLKKQSALTIEFLQNMAKSSSKGTLQVKEIDYLNSAVLTLIDPMLPSGTAYVTINGFGQIYTERPCLVISKAKSEVWFNYFFETFENTWKSSNSSSVV
jgi:hypothetical protein